VRGRGAGSCAGFNGEADGPQVTWVPQRPIRKAEQALQLLLTGDGPLATGTTVPGWLAAWESARNGADPVAGRLLIEVVGATLADVSVFDPSMTHRLSFTRRFIGFPEGRMVWLGANPIGADTADGNRPTLGKMRNISEAAGFGTVQVVNLYTARTDDIAALARFGGLPNHPAADDTLLEAASGGVPIVVACGDATNPADPGRYTAVMQLLVAAEARLQAVGSRGESTPRRTARGRPNHPRMLPGPNDAVLLDWYP